MSSSYGCSFTPISRKRNRLELILGVANLSHDFEKAKAELRYVYRSVREYDHIRHFEQQPQWQSHQRDSICDYPPLINRTPHSSFGGDEYSGMDSSKMELDELIYELLKPDPVHVQHQNPLNGERFVDGFGAFPEHDHFHSSSFSCIDKYSLHEAEVDENSHSEDISNLKKQLETYASNLSIITNQLQQTEDTLKKRSEELEQTKTRLDNANQKATQEISELRKQLEKSEAIDKRLTQQLQQSHEKAKTAIEELNNTKTRLNAVQKTIKVEKKSQFSFSKESQEMIDLRTQLKTVMYKEAIASHHLKETRETLRITRDELEKVESRHAEAEMRDQGLMQEISDLRKQLEKSEFKERASNHQLQQTNDKLKKIKDELEETKTRLNEALHGIDTDLKIMEKENRDLRTKLEQSKSTEASLNHQLQQVRSKLQTTTAELEDTKTRLAKTEKCTVMRDQEPTQEISDLRKQLEKSEFKERALNHQLQQTNDKLKKTKDELEETKTRLNEALQGIDTNLKKMEKENRDLRTKLEQSKSTEASLNHQLQQVRNKIQTTTAELEDTKTRLAGTEKCTVMRDEEPTQEISDLRKKLEKSEFKERASNYQLQQTQDELKKTNDELEETKTRLNEALQGIDTHLKKMEKENSDLRTQLEKSTEGSLNHQLQQVRNKLKTTTEELEDTKTRLSKLMGQKLTDNNPNITDLSDKNRPMKLGERFSELYDNEWTDAFEVVRSIYKDERTTVLTLLTILKDADKFCRAEAEKQIECLRKDLTLQLETDGSNIPSLINKQLKDCRKALGSDAGHRLLEIYIKKLSQSSSASARDALRVAPFLREAFPLCWLMSIQDPPVVFDRLLQHGEKFNTELYRSYTKAGPLVDFPVWPTMFLHEGGPLLYKGVAQGCDK